MSRLTYHYAAGAHFKQKFLRNLRDDADNLCPLPRNRPRRDRQLHLFFDARARSACEAPSGAPIIALNPESIRTLWKRHFYHVRMRAKVSIKIGRETWLGDVLAYTGGYLRVALHR